MEQMNTKKGQFEPARLGKLIEKHFTLETLSLEQLNHPII
jgi:hypothetical protein